jgi:hypothetical protein
MMTYKLPHECSGMLSAMDGKLALKYDPKDRSFHILANPKTRGGWSHTISHCPFCGGLLPSELSESWYELAKDYETGNGWDMRRLPKELRTDEWWRKRGL